MTDYGILPVICTPRYFDHIDDSVKSTVKKDIIL